MNLRAKMFVNPRFGKRRYRGIWPPSNPLIETPVRAVWPLPPRPPVFPLPDPIPRLTRIFLRRAPSLSRISFNFIVLTLFHFYHMLNFFNHSTNRRRILKFTGASDFIQTKATKDCSLFGFPSNRTPDLQDDQCLCFPLSHDLDLTLSTTSDNFTNFLATTRSHLPRCIDQLKRL